MKEDIMNPLKPAENPYRSRIWTNNKRLAYWHGAWVAATLLMAFGPIFLWKALAFTLLAVGLDLAFGVAMILATKKYVMELDELQQRVWLNSLGITVGVAVLAVPPLAVMGAYHVIPIHANIAHLMILMAATFLVSLVYGMWRYR
jgi:hypothetical protein